MIAEEVKASLLSVLPECELTVEGEGSHFDITVVAAVFDGLSSLKRQQLVYSGINEYIADGSIHAVNMKLYTPEQWRQQKSEH